MSEVERAAVMQAVVEKRLKQAEAAERLCLSVRQVKRLARRYREHGAAGWRRRVAAGARKQRAGRRRSASRTVGSGAVRGLGPTFAAEKHGLSQSRETLRKWMAAEGLWRPKGRREARVHQTPPRRPRFGELVRVDGSPHNWFEGRGPRVR